MPLPEFIGKYEIRRELGKGAMGAVYEGFDPVIKRPVAIKTILTEYLANVESDAAVARFKQEAQAGGRLQHPGIFPVGCPFLDCIPCDLHKLPYLKYL
jgi:serine/threonine protein kinase